MKLRVITQILFLVLITRAFTLAPLSNHVLGQPQNQTPTPTPMPGKESGNPLPPHSSPVDIDLLRNWTSSSPVDIGWLGGPTPVSPSAPHPPMIPTRYVFEVVRVNSRGRVEKKGAGEAQGRIEELGDGVTIELAMIPGGKFLMGGPMKGDEVQQSLKNEFPQHEVVTSTFLMGRFEVTQAQWRFVAEKLSRVSLDLIADPSHFKGEDLPVENVSWEEAIEFCERLTRKTGRKYRLPSEAEWEYACRAGTVTPFAFGETITTDLANFNGQYPYHPRVKGIYRTKTTQVGSFESANAFGLFDMHGNVWEWCQDVWHENYDGAPNDGSAWLSGGESEMRVARGGSWYYRATFCRSAFRYRFPSPSHKHNNIGFRVVMSVR